MSYWGKLRCRPGVLFWRLEFSLEEGSEVNFGEKAEGGLAAPFNLDLGRFASRNLVGRGVLDGECLDGWGIRHQRAQLCRNLLEQSVVIVLDIGTAVPKGSAAKLASCRVERFKVFDEAGLPLNTRQKLSIQRCTEFIDPGCVDLAGDDSRIHSVPPDCRDGCLRWRGETGIRKRG